MTRGPILFCDLEELLAAVLEGAFEKPMWGSFLKLLRAKTFADHAGMVFRPPGRPLSDAIYLSSDTSSLEGVQGAYTRRMATLDVLNEQQLEEGRAYTYGELCPPHDPEFLPLYEKGINGETASRVIRVTEASGVSAWLTISRTGPDFGEAETKVLEAIAPMLRGALRSYVALERERFASEVVIHAMRSLYFAWMTLDGNGRIVDCDPEAEVSFAKSGVISRSPDGYLRANPPKLEQEIHRAIERLALDPQAAPRALTLSRDPWLDVLLVRLPRSTFSSLSRATVIAYLHGDSWRSADRYSQLADLFGLTASEARVALTLSRGLSPAEAARELGLSIETIRSYTKVIYSKTGARGIADLVHIVMRSVMAFSPDRMIGH